MTTPPHTEADPQPKRKRGRPIAGAGPWEFEMRQQSQRFLAAMVDADTEFDDDPRARAADGWPYRGLKGE